MLMKSTPDVQIEILGEWPNLHEGTAPTNLSYKTETSFQRKII